MKLDLFPWIAECCSIMGKDKKYGAILIEDKGWAFAWDDGYTPEQAVKKFKEMYPDGYPKELEDKYL